MLFEGLLFFRLKFNGRAKRWRPESTISVYPRASGQILYVRDAQNRGKVMVVTGVMDDFSGPSALTIVERNGRRYVSSLALEEIGTKLEYSAPSPKTEAGRPTQASVQIIPVQVARS